MERERQRLLGVPQAYTREELRKAYIGKAKETHPDRGGERDGRAFQRVREAYEALLGSLLKGETEQERYEDPYEVASMERVLSGEEVICRCGEKYEITGLGIVECNGCSCFIEVVS
jgi:DnaJ-class molecular chaperone